MFGDIGGQGILLTGNAGMAALSNTARYAEKMRVLIPTNLGLVQIPYRGNDNHLESSLLDRLVGPDLRGDAMDRDLTALIFMPAGDIFPSNPLLVNTLLRRGARVVREDAGKEHVIYRSGGANSWAVGTIRLSSER